jgi:hypothetical protein
MSTYRLFPTTDGPAAPVDFGSGYEFVSAMGFWVTQPTMYFEGYWWWVCGTEQSTAPQTFCLWQDTDGADQKGDLGALVEASVVTSGDLVAGQWNYVPLPAAIPLTQYLAYRAATATPRYAPATNGQFGEGGVYAQGITNGPLFAFADVTSGNSGDVDFFQPSNCTYQEGTLDPTSVYPGLGYDGLNLWMDVQVTDDVPADATHRCWPNQPNPLYPPEAALPFTVSTQVTVSQPAQVLKVWFLSQTGNTKLPSICGIWDAETQDVVAGSVNDVPTWLQADGSPAAPGDGWCSCDYSAAGVVLAANHNYRVATGMYTSGYVWYSGDQGYWLTDGGGYPSQGIGASYGAGNGIIACSPCGLQPNPLTPCAQDTSGSWAYPNTVENDGDNYYIDLEVSVAGTEDPPPPPPASPSTINSGAFFTFFP